MTSVIAFTHAALTDEPRPEVAIETWSKQVDGFFQSLAQVDTDLVGMGTLPGDLTNRLLQGPLADTMTHVGQLAMLRRMAGSPISGESFFDAPIQSGTFDYHKRGSV